MKTPEHIFTVPEAYDADRARVDVPQKQVYCPSITKVSGGYVAAIYSNNVADSVTGGADCEGNIGAADGVPHGGCVDGAEGCGSLGYIRVQV